MLLATLLVLNIYNKVHASSRDFLSSLVNVEYNGRKGNHENILFYNEKVEIKKTVDNETELSFILLSASLDNGYELYIRVAELSAFFIFINIFY